MRGEAQEGAGARGGSGGATKGQSPAFACGGLWGHCSAQQRQEEGVEGGLGVGLAIEEQGVVDAAADGEIVEPGIGVGQAPEGDAADILVVLLEESEQAGVLLGLTLQNLRGAGDPWGGGRDVRRLALGEIGAAGLAREHVHVDLGEVRLHAGVVEEPDRVLDVLVGDAIDAPVALDANGVDAHAFGFEIANQGEGVITFRRRFNAEVVVVKLGARVGGMGETEGLLDEIGANALNQSVLR